MGISGLDTSRRKLALSDRSDSELTSALEVARYLTDSSSLLGIYLVAWSRCGRRDDGRDSRRKTPRKTPEKSRQILDAQAKAINKERQQKGSRANLARSYTSGRRPPSASLPPNGAILELCPRFCAVVHTAYISSAMNQTSHHTSMLIGTTSPRSSGYSQFAWPSTLALVRSNSGAYSNYWRITREH